MLKNYDGDSLTIEKCKVLVAKGEYNAAEHHLHVLLQSTTIRDPTDEIEARCLLAELLADHKNMLDEAIILLQKGREGIEKLAVRSESRLRIFLLLHQLAARQLTGIEEHMESRAFRMREDAIREWTRQRSIASQGAPTHAGRRIECELKCEREAVEAIKQKLVATAVDTVWAGLEALKLLSEPYLKQPQQPKQRNDRILRHIFPLIDVIFRFDGEKDVVKTFRMYVASGMVPAIWVHVVGHLMSHCFTKSILAPVVRSMIVKIIMAYPFHVLHTVLMYKFNENHAPIVQTILEEAERRVADRAAKMRLHEIIEDMTTAHVAYMQFVAAKVADTRFFKKQQVPGSSAVQYEMLDKLSIVRLTDVLQRVPLPVIDQKLCMPGDYSGDELVKWGPMERTCIQADGLSAPKVLRTKGSDGRLYKLIWKNEDVRQDCLVEQLFSIVNSILNDDEDAAFLRTYKVVPLDSKCGIIEFCQGTTSLKQLLCGLDLQGGLHAEEEPQDERAIKMRNVLKDAAKSPGNQASVMFQEACARFQPVFRHFFYRNYTTVREWTKMINNYRKSLAQWSIVLVVSTDNLVTYVVGLGDRHLSNVLFETDTCKLVHIDLGMILEYSKRTLPIPERVPFRLTRDLLDPLLIEGTGGRLEEEAVHAMQLLRDSKH
ncbi:phosphatidylinositol 3- and 4-kinase, partial [Ancylostoma duodenale]